LKITTLKSKHKLLPPEMMEELTIGTTYILWIVPSVHPDTVEYVGSQTPA